MQHKVLILGAGNSQLVNGIMEEKLSQAVSKYTWKSLKNRFDIKIMPIRRLPISLSSIYNLSPEKKFPDGPFLSRLPNDNWERVKPTPEVIGNAVYAFLSHMTNPGDSLALELGVRYQGGMAGDFKVDLYYNYNSGKMEKAQLFHKEVCAFLGNSFNTNLVPMHINDPLNLDKGLFIEIIASHDPKLQNTALGLKLRRFAESIVWATIKHFGLTPKDDG